MSAERQRTGGAFWRLWLGVGTSTLGDGIAFIAFPLLALTMTRRPILIAGVAVASQLPGFLVNPFAGAWADRYDRRRVAIAAEGVRLLIFALFGGLVAAGLDSLPLLYAVVVVIGCCESVFLACTTASTPALVPDSELERANGALSAAEITGRELVGQGAAGALFTIARSLPLVADAVCFLVSTAMAASSIPSSPGSPRATGVGAEMADGFRWFLGSRPLRRLAGVISVFALCNGGVQAVLVLYATGPLHIGRTGYGLLMATGSVGGLLASAIAGWVSRRLGVTRTVVLGGLLAGVAYLVLAAYSNPVVAGIAVSVEAVGLLLGNVASLSLRQRLVPEDLRGRVITTFRMVLTGSILLGALAGGLIVNILGLRACFIGAALLQLAAVAATALMANADLALSEVDELDEASTGSLAAVHDDGLAVGTTPASSHGSDPFVRLAGSVVAGSPASAATTASAGTEGPAGSTGHRTAGRSWIEEERAARARLEARLESVAALRVRLERKAVELEHRRAEALLRRSEVAVLLGAERDGVDVAGTACAAPPAAPTANSVPLRGGGARRDRPHLRLAGGGAPDETGRPEAAHPDVAHPDVARADVARADVGRADVARVLPPERTAV